MLITFITDMWRSNNSGKPPEVQKAHMKVAVVRGCSSEIRNLKGNVIKHGVIKTEKLINQRIKKTKSHIVFL